MKTHMDLDVWKLSIELVKDIYEITKLFPKEELFGLTSQIKRASISITSNIAEGASRQTIKEFIQFLYISLGSTSEVETQLIIAKELNFINENELDYLLNKIEKIKKMLNGLIKHLKDRNAK
ncbi:four helix bundle protein [Deferribacter thermophilus]|uniref:four helix bundle protein n=1 Tax=Deferribacter thermophilus TaxID=53573 RepID=UPI003C22D021